MDSHDNKAFTRNDYHHDDLHFIKEQTTRSSQMSLKQSQRLLTPPTTPPRSPPSSNSTKPSQKERMTPRVHFDLHVSTSQHTCLNTSNAMTESGLWTLPGLDDDEELESHSTNSQPQRHPQNRWARMLQSTASSNRQRHRPRFEHESWAFVGGMYSEDMQELSDASGESVDEEFDVVVLPRESVGC